MFGFNKKVKSTTKKKTVKTGVFSSSGGTPIKPKKKKGGWSYIFK